MIRRLFTSESVSNGHPDKVSDQVADAILEAVLQRDKEARVACEVLLKAGTVVIAGEITSVASVDLESIVRSTINEIGYDNAFDQFNGHNCSIITHIHKQSTDIASGVDHASDIWDEIGAGDQGMVFGYACNDTDDFMPAPIHYAHKIMKQHLYVRKNSKYGIQYLRPDAKCQITFNYVDGKATTIDTIVLSSQHSIGVDNKELRQWLISYVVEPVIPDHLITRDTRFIINPSGQFITGGPEADCGLTGRKIIVDTYGGVARHGGGAFSGKDPTKVDRSAAYMARYIAKNIVASGMAEKCEIQISYAISRAEPVSLYIDCAGTHQVSEESLLKMVRNNYNLHPHSIIRELDLLNAPYKKLASFGHFGRNELNLTWEQVKELV